MNATIMPLSTSGLPDEMNALAASIRRHVGKGGQVAAIPSLSLFRTDLPTEPSSFWYGPSVALIAQGAKRVVLGEDTYVYGGSHFLVTTMDVPTVTKVTHASPREPYLSVLLKLDLHVMSQMLMEHKPPEQTSTSSTRAMAISPVTVPLVNAFRRLVDLLDTPEDLAELAPLIEREILYRLIKSDQAPRLRQAASDASQSRQVGRAVEWLRQNYRLALRIGDLADLAHMSASTFHHHFRAMTSMSPLQMQKRLRLHEARRLMLIEKRDANTAAFDVGYSSSSQFSREYTRLFGAPPHRDIKQLRDPRQTQAA